MMILEHAHKTKIIETQENKCSAQLVNNTKPPDPGATWEQYLPTYVAFIKYGSNNTFPPSEWKHF